MAKCPWCGWKVRIDKNCWGTWNHSCIKGCYHSQTNYPTYINALSAASKRFMPKRTVDEITNGVQRFLDMWADEANKYDGHAPKEYLDYLEAIMYHRIANFIYGVDK